MLIVKSRIMKKILIILALALSVVFSINGANLLAGFSNTNKGNKMKNEAIVKTNTTINQETLSGTWYWKSTTTDNDTELYLVQNGNTVTGKHCSSFIGGSKLDCVSNTQDDSVLLNMVSNNIFEGTIKSEISGVIISVRITLDPLAETIQFQQLTEPIEEYYLPNNVTMTLAQD